MIAGQQNNLKIVQALAEQGRADLNLRDKEGRTAMMLAAEKGNFTVVEYLTKVGADYNITDNNGVTVYDTPDRTSGASAAEMRKNVEAAVARGLASAAAAKAELEAQQEQAARDKQAAEEAAAGEQKEEEYGSGNQPQAAAAAV